MSLPVIVSGAGPCGLLCAVVLQKYSVPFILVERVEESKLTADVGSGFDMAPTAVRIFEHLGLPQWKERMSNFSGITIMSMSGDHIRLIPATELPGQEGQEAYATKRSTLQQCLVEKLGSNLVSGSNAHFGVFVTAHEEASDGSKVTVTLSNGITLEGRALLVCEGWRSLTRERILEGGSSPGADPVNFCNIAMWWGKCEVSPTLKDLLRPTQTAKEGGSFCMFLGDGSEPGNFVAAPAKDGDKDFILWSAAQQALVEPGQTDDLTRRGGVRGEQVKEELQDVLRRRCELLQEIVKATPASDVTKVGLYDRKNLSQSSVSPTGLVALLGDASHPQTPFLGQGCNMALADAFAVCTRLGVANNKTEGTGAVGSVRAALSCLDAQERKMFARKTVLNARYIARLMTSDSSIKGFVMRKSFQYLPTSFIFPRVDEGNRTFVNQALKDCSLPILPENL
eukprot:CAMPEP_0195512852 /NCGR_PEP_ID=MMETSP0794_2-20130614/4666_1 /TAXON_ID=515487 /ORGANISM="Stephanopyxis turris, Strain CCMP 815" /LENGTH=453 /DNA_ID=CAMNT_0040640729 /DNA_START=47 /DNA_END=1408 /DNA_ORIENTATION=+